MADLVRDLITRWRKDPAGTYRTWFLWEERLKNFRSIRRGIAQVIAEIQANTFGNVYKGSSLETVVGSIAEQRQIFKGADHAFLWKPKLRIPDIYENYDNQRAFAGLLHACSYCDTEGQVLAAIDQLDQHRIKGLGPAVANILYFLHPTIAPPFNTAIVNGYNRLTGAAVKLGHWDQYIAMRRGVLALNETYRDLLSNDLGAIAGLLFDIGSGRYVAPPLEDSTSARAAWEADIADLRKQTALSKVDLATVAVDETHTEVQGWLRDLGKTLGYRVWIAANDGSRQYGGGRLGDGCIEQLPPAIQDGPGGEAIRLIDVLWVDSISNEIAAAFEVEHTTSIYSGIVRLLDLALSGSAGSAKGLFLVAPDDRENAVRAQLARPAFSRVADLAVRYLPYGELRRNREAIARFGYGMKAIEAISRVLN